MTLQQTTINTSTVITYPRLSVQVRLTGLSFLLETTATASNTWDLIFDQKLNPAELLIKLVDFYNQHSELKQHKGTVCVVYYHKEFTLVPLALFDPEQMASYLKYNTKLLASDYLDYDQLDHQEMVNVYVPFTNINNFIFETHGDFTFLHSNTVLIQAVMAIQKTGGTAQVFANVVANSLDLIALKGNNVLLCNSYTITCPEDFAYFLLFAVEQLELDPETLHLVFTDGVSNQDDYFALAYRYIRNVSVFNKANKEVSFILQNAFA